MAGAYFMVGDSARNRPALNIGLLIGGITIVMMLAAACYRPSPSTPDLAPSDQPLGTTESKESALFPTTESRNPSVRTSLPVRPQLLRFAEDGRHFGVLTHDGRVAFHDATDAQVLKTTAAFHSPGRKLRSLPNGYFATETPLPQDGVRTIEIRDLMDPERPVLTIPAGSNEEALCATRDPIAVWTMVRSSAAATISRWDESAAAPTQLKMGVGQIQDSVLITDGRRLIVGNRSRVDVYSLDGSLSGEIAPRAVLSTTLLRAALHPTEEWLAVVPSAGDRVVMWSLHTQLPFAEIINDGEEVVDLAFDAQGRRLAVVSKDRIRVWDTELRYLRMVVPVANAKLLAFSPDGESLAAIADNGQLTIWKTSFPSIQSNIDTWWNSLGEARKTELEPFYPEKEVYNPRRATTDDGRLAVIAPEGKQPYLEETATHERFFEYPTNFVLSVAVSPNGKWAVTGGRESDHGTGNIRQWDLRSGREVGVFPGHVHFAWSLAFSPDGRFLLSGGKATMYLWDVATRTQIRQFPVTFAYVRHVAFSQDGRHALARTNFGQPQYHRNVLFSVETGQALWEFNGEVPEWAFVPLEILGDSRFGEWRTLSSDAGEIP